jgi:hypothetical protein
MTKESKPFWHAPDIGDLELLKATDISHTFQWGCTAQKLE